MLLEIYKILLTGDENTTSVVSLAFVFLLNSKVSANIEDPKYISVWGGASSTSDIDKPSAYCR